MHYLSHLAELGAANLHPHGRVATARLVECLDLRPGQRVLEVGCGTGETLVRVALAADVTITGVDVLPEMLGVARRRLRVAGLQRRARTAEVRAGAALPFPDNSYHRVFMESVLGFQDASSAESLLAEVFRVLKGGGRAVLNEAVWRPSIPDEVVAAVHRSCLADFGLCHASEQNWSAEDWCRAMRAAGFTVLSAKSLAALKPSEAGSRGPWLPPRLLLSRLVTASYRVRAALSPRLVGRQRTYRARLRQHKDDGQLIEAHLFILEKPNQMPDRLRTGVRASAP
jgi:ubiquinone/menaquinone biosynthesis C-methylase UbiE